MSKPKPNQLDLERVFWILKTKMLDNIGKSNTAPAIIPGRYIPALLDLLQENEVRQLSRANIRLLVCHKTTMTNGRSPYLRVWVKQKSKGSHMIPMGNTVAGEDRERALRLLGWSTGLICPDKCWDNLHLLGITQGGVEIYVLYLGFQPPNDLEAVNPHGYRFAHLRPEHGTNATREALTMLYQEVDGPNSRFK